jgi:hemerythrin HHE cation binding domain-containing protein
MFVLGRLLILNSLMLATTVLLSRPPLAQQSTQPEVTVAHTHPLLQALEIPASLRAEHEEIHTALERATQAPGRVGEAARALAKVLHPHFVREEQIALPPLGLLAPLARNEFTEAMLDVLPMTDSLRAELPHMLEEHVAIRAATQRLGEVARAERNASVARLAEQLALHAKSEEEMFYPAAVLVGDIVRARADGHHSR